MTLQALVIAILFITCKKEKDEPDPIVEFPETVTDHDGNVYDVVVIGNQAWMAENLKVTHYADGSPIHTGLINTHWETTTQGAYAVFSPDHIHAFGIENEAEMTAIYGLLYNWHAVNDSRGLCPEGWKVPSEFDWREMLDYILDNHDDINADNIGNALKSCRQLDSPLGGDCNPEWGDQPYWFLNTEHHGTDLFGFSALPAGSRSPNGSYNYITGGTFYWESTHGSQESAPARVMAANTGEFYRHFYFLNNGFSVRCVWKGE